MVFPPLRPSSHFDLGGSHLGCELGLLRRWCIKESNRARQDKGELCFWWALRGVMEENMIKEKVIAMLGRVTRSKKFLVANCLFFPSLLGCALYGSYLHMVHSKKKLSSYDKTLHIIV